MIVTRIEALGFRSLRYVSQRLERFHVLVGPNASGKSAFLDVLAFLGDLQRVGVAQAITGNAAQDVPLRAVDPQHLTWMRRGSTLELAVEATIPDHLRERFQGQARSTPAGTKWLIDVSRAGAVRGGDPLAEAGRPQPAPNANERISRIRWSRLPGWWPIRQSERLTGWKKSRLAGAANPSV